MYIISIFVILLFLSTSSFLLVELLKKFQFWKSFQQDYKEKVSWQYHWNKLPAMYTLEISWSTPFSVLIGLEFSFWFIKNAGYDVFGYMKRDTSGKLYVSLYLWHGPVELDFLITGETADHIQIRMVETSQKPDYIFLPHWWQKLGFFG